MERGNDQGVPDPPIADHFRNFVQAGFKDFQFLGLVQFQPRNLPGPQSQVNKQVLSRMAGLGWVVPIRSHSAASCPVSSKSSRFAASRGWRIPLVHRATRNFQA